MQKQCQKCYKIKNIFEFVKSKKTKDGYYYCCKDCKKIINRKYCSKHKKYMKEYHKKYREKLLAQQKIYYEKNKEKIKKLREKNKKEIKEYNKKYAQTHKKERNKYLKELRKKDIDFKLVCYLRTRIWGALKGINKYQSTTKLTGCSIKYLKQYLEKRFEPGMTWKNYGKWHVDHIIPCYKFSLSKSSEQKKCFRYTNLQPLWAKENMRKNS